MLKVHPIVRSLIDKYGVTNIYGEDKKDISEIEQRSKEWYKQRYDLISSSNASAILGLNKYMLREDLFNEKIQPFNEYYNNLLPEIEKSLDSVNHKHSKSNPINWGIKYEPFAKYIYEKINNTFVYEFGIIKHNNPLNYWLGASPDGITKDGRLLEIKCLWNRKNNEKIPILPYIWVQTQIQMEVTNLDECDLFECKFIEYSSKEQYDNDNGDNIINLEDYYTDSSSSDSSSDSDTQELREKKFTNNLPFQVDKRRSRTLYKNIQFKGYDDVSDTYWKLESYVCRTVKRDRDWFNIIAYPKLMMFWKEVEEERDNRNRKNKKIIEEQEQQNIRMTVKRKIDTINSTADLVDTNNKIVKKRHIDTKIESNTSPIIDYSTYITENNISNYIQNDTLVDWLYKFGSEKYAISNKLDKLNKFMKERYMNYKIHIYNKLLSLFGTNMVKIILNKNRHITKKDISKESKLSLSDIIRYPAIVDKYVKETKNALTKYPIICNSILVNNKKEKIFQYDLLIRGDFINVVFKDVLDKKTINNIVLKNRDKYFIIKILNTKAKHKKDKITIQNTSNKIKIKKAQAIFSNIYIDNSSENRIIRQSINRDYIFIIPYENFNNEEKIVEKINMSYTVFNNYGTIDIYGKDNALITKIYEAIKWWKEMSNNGCGWKLNPPSVPELYPNMKNTTNTDWSTVKKKIATNLGEITNLWGCSLKDRKLLNKKGITSWKDEKFNMNYLKHYSDEKKFIIKSMIELNKKSVNSNKNIINKKTLIYNKDKLLTFKDDIFEKNNYTIDFFIDFETINNIDSNNLVSNTDITDMINIIGVGYINPESDNNEWIFKKFIANRLTFNEEKRIISEWIEYMKDVIEKYNLDEPEKINKNQYKCRIYHWSSAEFNMMKRFIKKLEPDNNHNDKKIISNIHQIFYDYNWVDLLHIFKDTPIIVKGAFNFSLKTISNALYNLKEIDILWEDNNCVNGMESMFVSIEANKWAINENKDIIDYKYMLDVIKYNEIDCKVMWKILLFLQKIIK